MTAKTRDLKTRLVKTLLQHRGVAEERRVLGCISAMGLLSRSRPALAWLVPFTRRVGGAAWPARPGTDTGGARRGVYVATPTDQEKRYPMYERLRATAGNENTAEKVRSPLTRSTLGPDVLPIAKSLGKR